MTVRYRPLTYSNASYRGYEARGDRVMTKADRNERKVKDDREGANKNNGPENAAVAAKHSATVVLMSQGGRRAVGDRTDTPAASERRAQGKALRDAVPRTSHAGW